MDSPPLAYIGSATLAIVLVPLYYFVKSHIRNIIIKKTTGLQDLPNLALPRAGKRIQGTAVVCGGSIAGLWTARVCADHFEDVLIVEPEEWIGTEEGSSSIYDAEGHKVVDTVHDRARVQQYSMLHIHLPFAHRALKRFYPNVDEEMVNNGARIKPSTYNVHIDGILTDHLPYQDYPDGNVPTVYFATRETFERALRKMLYKCNDRIRWSTGTVTNVHLSASDKSRIETVSVRTPHSDLEKTIPSSLVVDCSGGAHTGLKWLKRLNPSTGIDNYRDSYDAKIRYRNFRFPVPPDMRDRLPIPGGYSNAAFIYAFAPNASGENRLYLAQWLEGHRIEICCGAMGDCDFPERPADLVPWGMSLRGKAPVPQWVFEMIEMLRENEEEVVIKDTGRVPACSWVHYENLSHLIPSNFIAIGDSVMRVNPIYGQGCTKACVGAATLDGLLRTATKGDTLPRNFSEAFFELHASRIKPLWDGTKALDYAYETTIPVKGETLAKGSLDRAFVEQLNKLLARADKDAVSALFHYRMFLGPASDLFQPRLLAKILLVAIQDLFSASK